MQWNQQSLRRTVLPDTIPRPSWVSTCVYMGGCTSISWCPNTLDHQNAIYCKCSITLAYCWIMVLENVQEFVGFRLGGASGGWLPKCCVYRLECSKGTQRDDSVLFLYIYNYIYIDICKSRTDHVYIYIYTCNECNNAKQRNATVC